MTLKLEGWRALDEITKLHGKEFFLNSGAVGHYDLEQEVTVWVAGAPFEWMANRMVHEMESKIREGYSPFVLADDRQHKGHHVFVLEGLGQQHYFF